MLRLRRVRHCACFLLSMACLPAMGGSPAPVPEAAAWSLTGQSETVQAGGTLTLSQPHPGGATATRPLALPAHGPWRVAFEVKVTGTASMSASVEAEGNARAMAGVGTGDAPTGPSFLPLPRDGAWHRAEFVSDGATLLLWRDGSQSGRMPLPLLPNRLVVRLGAQGQAAQVTLRNLRVEALTPPPATPPSDPAVTTMATENGEVCVQGTIRAVSAAHGSLLLDVSSVFQPGGGKVTFAAPRPKTVWIGSQTTLQKPDAPGSVPGLTDLNGLEAMVIGEDRGAGGVLPARLILLWSPATNVHFQTDGPQGSEDSLAPPPRYAVTDLGVLPGDIESVATGLNDKGDVVGQSVTTRDETGTEIGHGFVWKAGRMYDLGTAAGYKSSAAFRVNNSGQVVGCLDNFTSTSHNAHTISRGCWWQGGTSHVLSPGKAGTGTLAMGINSAGAIVGSLLLPLHKGGPGISSHAFVWRSGHLTELAGVAGFSSCTASAINDMGDIGCNAQRFENEGGQVRLLSRAYLWSGGKKTDLGVLPGCNSATVNGINNLGEIIGQATSATYAVAVGPQRPFVWQNHRLTELRQPEGRTSSSPFGLNDQGEIVGIAGNGDGLGMETVAVLWRGGQVYDLNTLIPSDAGWTLNVANAVNSQGQIAGDGLHDGQKRGFLLTPLP